VPRAIERPARLDPRQGDRDALLDAVFAESGRALALGQRGSSSNSATSSAPGLALAAERAAGLFSVVACAIGARRAGARLAA
jgi:hypothetical protein